MCGRVRLCLTALRNRILTYPIVQIAINDIALCRIYIQLVILLLDLNRVFGHILVIIGHDRSVLLFAPFGSARRSDNAAVQLQLHSAHASVLGGRSVVLRVDGFQVTVLNLQCRMLYAVAEDTIFCALSL